MDHEAMLTEKLYMDELSHWLCRRGKHNEGCMLLFDWSNEIFLTTLIPANMNVITQLRLMIIYGSLYFGRKS